MAVLTVLVGAPGGWDGAPDPLTRAVAPYIIEAEFWLIAASVAKRVGYEGRISVLSRHLK